MEITFQVEPLELERKMLPVNEVAPLLKGRGVFTVEASSFSSAPFVLCEYSNGFLMAAHLAYAEHYPLIISPDDIWLCIAQGLARHINENAEKLRPRLVSHQGKLELKIRRDDLVMGSSQNDWPGVFREFSTQLRAHLGKKSDLFVSNFSTTDLTSRVASEIVFMSAVKNYFSYVVETLCGIPAITLRGTPTDWAALRRRAEVLSEFDLDWWSKELCPVLEKIEASSRGEVDVEFWRDFYKVYGGSGGDQISGWVNVLFPYLNDEGRRRNEFIAKPDPRSFFLGPTMDQFPSGLSQAPFLWQYLGRDCPMLVVAGFWGVTQEGNGALRPLLGWAVAHGVESADFLISRSLAFDRTTVKPREPATLTSTRQLVAQLKSAPAVDKIELWECKELVSLEGFDGLKVPDLLIYECPQLKDITPLANAEEIKGLSLFWLPLLEDLSAITKIRGLTRLSLSECPALRDLSPIATLVGLQQLSLKGESIPPELQGSFNRPEEVRAIQEKIQTLFGSAPMLTD